MMRDTDLAVATHAREELGISPGSLGSPLAAAASSFGSFALGAAVPLVPWIVMAGTAAAIGTVGISALLALGIGLALAGFTGRSRVHSGARQLLLSALAAAIAYGIGAAVGVARLR
jgi:VIT1/CCC1 family predicted Fe2+/Mn2+ transporter